MEAYDAIVIGAGPNGLSAAITLARAGRSVLLVEAQKTPGGGCRTQELTLPGFAHDVCSAIHPLARASPFLRTLPLEQFGVEWIEPPTPLAHPMDDGTAMALERSIAQTIATLGYDAAAYQALLGPLVADWQKIAPAVLGPVLVPRHPFALARFGLRAILPASLLATSLFKREYARALFAGLSAHAMLPLEHSPSAAFGLVLATLGHSVGWPFPRGGSQQLVDALAAYLRSLDGEIITGVTVKTLAELPPARAYLCDIGPLQLLHIAGDSLPHGYQRQLRRYRYGMGVFKVDFALSSPIPWRAAACIRAGTVHVGGTLAEIAASERAAWRGEPAERPFVLVAQQSLFDATRAPTGKQVAWAYCHVPHGSSFDMTARIEAQIERFAPGFRDCILARHVMGPAALKRYNANYIGGDINGGAPLLRQLFTRPSFRLVPYSTPNKSIFICSSSTPPGGGVHGMCGYHAAQAALQSVLK